jgi:hypothetical protein
MLKRITSWLILIMLICVLAMGAISTARRLSLRQQRILFDVIYSHPASHVSSGIYITVQGELFEFKEAKSLVQWALMPKSTQPFTAYQLFRSTYGFSGEQIASIDEDTLKHMTDLTQKASQGEGSNRQFLCDDAGSLIYRAFLYDFEYHTHTPVFLYGYGDVYQENMSNESKILVEWLTAFYRQSAFQIDLASCTPDDTKRQ